MHGLIENLQEYLSEQKNITDYQACQILAMVRDYKPIIHDYEPIKLKWESGGYSWVAWTIKEWGMKFEVKHNRFTNRFVLYYSDFLINDDYVTLENAQQEAQNAFDMLAYSCFKPMNQS